MSNLLTFEEQRDSFTREGAEKQCEKIREYWAARGFTVNVHPVLQGFHRSLRGHYYATRSDMRNGLPYQENKQGRAA